MMTAGANKAEGHLYVHVPFCRTICGYCDFCRVVYRRETAEQWLDALQFELNHRDDIPAVPETIYIGGGTPTSLDADLFARLLELTGMYAKGCTEYTVEVNPETLDETKAAMMRKAGVNRVSMGFQSSDPKELAFMNRHHTMDTVRRAAQLLRDNGIDNLSLDLIYGLPGQDAASLDRSIADALSIQPKHMSLYSLTIEENSIFGKKGVAPCDEELEADLYELVCARMQEAGFERYEIANFARDGYCSRHNTAYWEYRDFCGVSAGASGKSGHMRYDVERSLAAYLKNPLARTEIPLTVEDVCFETVMMSLRMKKGLKRSLFLERTGRNLDDIYGNVIRELCMQGLLMDDGERIFCTERGASLLNDVLESFLP